MVKAAMKLKDTCSLEEKLWQTKKQRRYFANISPSSQSYGFSSSHVWIWELDDKESWAPKNWCFWTVVLEKTLESPLDCKEIKPVNPKGNQNIHWKDWCWSWKTNTWATWCEELTHWKRPWCWERLKAGGDQDDRGWGGWMASLTRRTRVWVSSGSWWWTRKPGMLQSMDSQWVGPDWATELNEKEWRQKEKGVAEDDMIRQCHFLNGHEFEQTLVDYGGQVSPVCCSPWGFKESDTN